MLVPLFDFYQYYWMTFITNCGYWVWQGTLKVAIRRGEVKLTAFAV